MEAETQTLKKPETEEKEVVNQHQETYPLLTTTEHGIQDSPGFSRNMVTKGGGNDGIISQSYRFIDASNSFLYTNTPERRVYEAVPLISKEEVQEIYLKNMFLMPPNHEFYCPKCNVCIEKVLFCKRREEPPAVKRPVGPSVIEPTVDEPSVIEPPIVEPPIIDYEVRCSACFGLLIEKGKQFFTWLLSRAPGSGPGTSISVKVDPTPPPGVIRPETSKAWEILKSIVYGGLAELLASLSVVTSAASADATTLNIVALAIANLIGGLFVLGHNLRDLKSSQPREEDSETNAAVDKYYELLGRRENSLLHAFVAILSVLIFGLVPPVVYGFSFRESDDKDLKLAAVAGASLLCITLLAIAKAYTQRPNNYVTYFKTVFFYVTSGVLVSLLTYVAGALMKRLVEHLGWFEPRSKFGLSLPEMSIEKPGWGSY